jgi:hypothetical protein
MRGYSKANYQKAYAAQLAIILRIIGSFARLGLRWALFLGMRCRKKTSKESLIMAAPMRD